MIRGYGVGRGGWMKVCGESHSMNTCTVGVLECWGCWGVGLLGCCSVGVLACWSFRVLEYWSVGVFGCWGVAGLGCFSFKVLEYMSVGVLGCCSFGMLEF